MLCWSEGGGGDESVVVVVVVVAADVVVVMNSEPVSRVWTSDHMVRAGAGTFILDMESA